MAIWDKITSSGNVEDRRGLSGGGFAAGGIGGLVLILAFMFLGGDTATLEQVLSQVTQQSTQTSEQSGEFSGADEYEVFASKVVGSNNEYWAGVFKERGNTYTEPKLVLFRGITQSACGAASSSVGPHYCPIDQTIYLDETFFDQLQQQLGGSKGDVAQAYVLSHEVGHHVQNLQGTMESVLAAQQEQSQDAQKLAIGLELQADCYAGLWVGSISEGGVLEPNEVEEALSAAAAVGDDRVQQKTTGTVNPENWTHGSSEQRTKWFTQGFNTGNPASCNPT